ncbi:MAG: CHAT domain-containing protein [Pseudomonadota bacterium]
MINAVHDGALPVRNLWTALAILEAARSGRRASELDAAADMVALDGWVRWREQLAQQPTPRLISDDEFSRAEKAPMLPATSATVDSQLALMDQIPPESTAVFFQWHHDRDFSRRAFVLSGGEIRTVELDTERRADAQLALLGSGVRSGDHRRISAALEELRQMLVDPLAGALSQSEGPLVFLPDGELHAVPLGAIGGDNPRLLHASSYGSLKAWSNASRASTAVAPDFSIGPTIFANPMPPITPMPGTGKPANHDRLPATLTEAAAIADSWAGSRILSGAAASESEALAALTGGTAWLHFATHVKIQPDDPLNSSLQLAPDDRSDGWLTVRELSKLRLPPKVVLLSACESAAGRRLTGEGLIGLTSTLLDAGAVSVAANLWPIDDALASRFVSRWYARLRSGLPLGAALAETRQEFAAAGYPASAWAGWIIAGDSAVALSEGERTPQRMLWAIGGGIMLVGALLLALSRSRRTQAN